METVFFLFILLKYVQRALALQRSFVPAAGLERKNGGTANFTGLDIQYLLSTEYS